MARGVFPDSDPLNLKMPGMHGNAATTTAMPVAPAVVNRSPIRGTATQGSNAGVERTMG